MAIFKIELNTLDDERKAYLNFGKGNDRLTFVIRDDQIFLLTMGKEVKITLSEFVEYVKTRK